MRKAGYYRMAVLGIMLACAAAACSSYEYKGDIRDITDVGRPVIERERKLLEERVNGWARSMDRLQKDEKIRQPIEDNRTGSFAGDIDSGRAVLQMLDAKLAGGAPKASFTREEWGRAEAVYCRLLRE